jgi:hypothetical protein
VCACPADACSHLPCLSIRPASAFGLAFRGVSDASVFLLAPQRQVLALERVERQLELRVDDQRIHVEPQQPTGAIQRRRAQLADQPAWGSSGSGLLDPNVDGYDDIVLADGHGGSP